MNLQKNIANRNQGSGCNKRILPGASGEDLDRRIVMFSAQSL